MKKILIMLAGASIASAANADNCLDELVSYSQAQQQLGFATAVHFSQPSSESSAALAQAEAASAAAHGALLLCAEGETEEADLPDRHADKGHRE